MKKTITDRGNSAEITIAAQAYLPLEADGTYNLEGIISLPYDRRFSISVSLNSKISLFSITNLEEEIFGEALFMTEEVVKAYLSISAENPEETIEGFLREEGYE